jgi:hypothetical protein
MQGLTLVLMMISNPRPNTIYDIIDKWKHRESETDNMTDENNNFTSDQPDNGDQMDQRLERLGGEPAPVITPEEFARLQKAGQVHIDTRGRVNTSRRSDADVGVSLRKRRAWYDR